MKTGIFERLRSLNAFEVLNLKLIVCLKLRLVIIRTFSETTFDTRYDRNDSKIRNGCQPIHDSLLGTGVPDLVHSLPRANAGWGLRTSSKSFDSFSTC